jgi:hypothetical protein
MGSMENCLGSQTGTVKRATCRHAIARGGGLRLRNPITVLSTVGPRMRGLTDCPGSFPGLRRYAWLSAMGMG